MSTGTELLQGPGGEGTHVSSWWEGEAKEEQAKQLPGFVLLVRFGVGWSGFGYNGLRTIVWNSTWGYSKLHNNNTL